MNSLPCLYIFLFPFTAVQTSPEIRSPSNQYNDSWVLTTISSYKLNGFEQVMFCCCISFPPTSFCLNITWLTSLIECSVCVFECFMNECSSFNLDPSGYRWRGGVTLDWWPVNHRADRWRQTTIHTHTHICAQNTHVCGVWEENTRGEHRTSSQKDPTMISCHHLASSSGQHWGSSLVLNVTVEQNVSLLRFVWCC